MRYTFSAKSMIYMDSIGFHLYLLMFSDFEGLDIALHPRSKRFTSALQMCYKFHGIPMIYMGFICVTWYLAFLSDLEGLGITVHPRYKCVKNALQL